MIKRPLIGLAILTATAVLAMTACGSSSNQTYPDTATGTPAASTTASGASSELGQGVDQTCQDLVGFFAFVKDADLAHGGHSVSDIEKAAAAASELAGNAPAEPSTSFLSGEPRRSLETIANAYGTYLSVLSASDLEPGPDALLDPQIASVLQDVAIDASTGLGPWVDARCSEDVKAWLTAS